MRMTVIATIVFWGHSVSADVIRPQGTLVSGVAVYVDEDSVRHEAPGVQLYCAWGRYGDPNEGMIVIDCYDIWGIDCTSGTANRADPRGLFHFHHPDRRDQDPAVSLMHRLDIERNAGCGQATTPRGRYFSRFFTPRAVGDAHAVKTEFELHPTYKPFKSTEEAAKQIAETAAVQYFSRVKLGEREGPERSDAEIRRAIHRETAIILDLMMKEHNPERVLNSATKELSRYVIRDGDRQIPLVEFLPGDLSFWSEPGSSSRREFQHWQDVRPLLEGPE